MRQQRHRGVLGWVVVYALAANSAVAAPTTVVEASYAAPFGHGGSWSVRLDDDGRARFSRSAEERSVIIAKDDMRELARIINDQRVYDLARTYGEAIEDGSRRWIRLSDGKRSTEVTLYGDLERDARVEEVKRAVAVWDYIAKVLERKRLLEPRAGSATR